MTRPPITVPPARVYKRYGEYTCKECGFQVSPLALCNCKAPAAESPTQDGAESGLEQRIRDVKR